MTVVSTETDYELLAAPFRPVFDRIAGGQYSPGAQPGAARRADTLAESGGIRGGTDPENLQRGRCGNPGQHPPPRGGAPG